MTTIQIILAVFSSSLLAAGLTAGANYYLTTVNYRNEYYKKLLERRLTAYEEVYNFLGQLKTLILGIDEIQVTPYLLSQGVDYLNKITIDLLVPMKSGVWLSSDLSMSLTDLNVYLTQLSVDAGLGSDPDKELFRLGHERLLVIREKRKNIEALMKRDFQTMHKIEEFVKS